ncbi:hypothetical protein GH714_037930 [Hevea brasiliensis]|uniref:Uncharacterized protein n=1 Tax=Hevea brasiliensis TaxID=3981 RepID=A0A6A6KNT2_HEVBR|nr:hypothetical protein GH714_037930 [Hevea brasiliensis]
MPGYQTVKGLRDYMLSGSRIDSARGYASPTRQVGQRTLRNPINAAQERPPIAPGNASKSRLGDDLNGRKSKCNRFKIVCVYRVITKEEKSCYHSAKGPHRLDTIGLQSSMDCYINDP